MILAFIACAPSAARVAPPAGADLAFAGCVADQLVDIEMDGVAEYRWTEHFDALGRKLRVDGDAGMDGTIDAVMHYLHLPDGRESSRAWDGNADGRIEQVTMRQWAVHGEAAIYIFGERGVHQVERFTYDEEGRRVSSALDLSADGWVDVEKTWLFDGGSSPTDEVFRDRRNGATGANITWEYDDDGRLTTERQDRDNDGRYDTTERRTYDGLGRRETARWDTDGDGRTDTFTFWRYTCPYG